MKTIWGPEALGEVVRVDEKSSRAVVVWGKPTAIVEETEEKASRGNHGDLPAPKPDWSLHCMTS